MFHTFLHQYADKYYAKYVYVSEGAEMNQLIPMAKKRVQ